MEESKKSLNLKEKAKETWSWSKAKAKEAWDWSKGFYEENKDFLKVVAPLAIGGAAMAAKSAKKRSEDREERDYKSRSIWDPRSGQWFTTRKPMTSNQKVEFARRKAEGEDVYDILNDMRLI